MEGAIEKLKEMIKRQAIDLASILKNKLEQYKVSIVFPDETVMLSTEPEQSVSE